MPAYYNEIDPYAAQWLRNLIANDLLPAGDVDERSIIDVGPDDLRGYEQAHFFAGIGGWPAALRLAGWPDRCEVWTGSCPCQPLSSAGQHNGHADERHLWPAFYSLIAKCKPSIVFGEQVASKDGREWFSGVRADLEALGYACGGSDLPACCFGAPHERQRLFWVANSNLSSSDQWTPSRQQPFHKSNLRIGEAVGNTTREQMGQRRQPWEQSEAVECEDGWRRVEPGAQPLAYGIPRRLDKMRGYGNAIVPQVAAEFIAAFSEAIGQ